MRKSLLSILALLAIGVGFASAGGHRKAAAVVVHPQKVLFVRAPSYQHAQPFAVQLPVRVYAPPAQTIIVEQPAPATLTLQLNAKVYPAALNVGYRPEAFTLPLAVTHCK